MRNIRSLAVIIAVALVLTLVQPATAQSPTPTKWVCPGGTCGHAGAQYSTIQAAVDASVPGDVISVAAGTYAGATVDESVTLWLEPGVVITGGTAPCFTIAASSVFIHGSLATAKCAPPNGASGIVVNTPVSDLMIVGLEIDGSTPTTVDGIRINAAVTNLKILDNYIHNMGSDGLEYTAAGDVTGTHVVQGNLFKANTGHEAVNDAGNATYNLAYNAWGDQQVQDYTGPMDILPIIHANMNMDSDRTPDHKVAVGQTITYAIRIDANEIAGMDVDLTFDKTKVTVQSITDRLQLGHDTNCRMSTVAEANASGVITFCGYKSAPPALTGQVVELYTVTFQATATGSTPLNFDETSDSFYMFGTADSTNIYASGLDDATLEIYGTHALSGRVDLQGRAVDSGVLVDLGAGTLLLNDPASTNTNSWGRFSFSGVVDDTYPLAISAAKYLRLPDGITLTLGTADRVLNPLMLYAGDVNLDQAINASDAATVGGVYGTTNPSGDVNGDGTVNLADLVLVGGNFGKTSATAYSGWVP